MKILILLAATASCRVLDLLNNLGTYVIDASPKTNRDAAPDILTETELSVRHPEPEPVIVAHQNALRDDESGWMFKCTIPTAATVADCEVVLSQVIALRPDSHIVVGEIGCKRWDWGNCRASICASGQNYVSINAMVASHSMGRVLMTNCLMRGTNGIVANCGDFGGACENFQITLGHINDTLHHPAPTHSNALPAHSAPHVR
ncbi:hypothetical protein PFICI_01140 [Pestalotiopsis fici W106-1]|uniref:Pectate lyase n=1 Tax=Pestalotiopsis fici (strain W106-1 / CGMCC3.15140) TaxID=1229662 RepID=W3XP75_PESFW|nr:uncharacterized protein PFICI_01140 [Pestalotiopsis fici W106-1]ETS87312.1 hypothetical protein PFICI_01140 [Pestalotiopsis fici W106-1]